MTTRSQRLARWTLAAALALLAFMAWPMARGRVHTYDDLGAYHLPVRAFYASQLARGEPFDWMPQLFGGFFLSGDGQAGTYHPLHRLLYGGARLPVAFELELLLSYPFMFAGTWLWLRRRLRRADAAMLGSLVFTFSGFNLLRFVHPNAVAVTAHLPWLLWALDVAILDPRPSRRVGAEIAVALLTASQLLLGYPQYVWFSLLAEAVYVAILVARTTHGRAATLFRLGAALAAGFLLGATQLLATWDALADSTRAAAAAAEAPEVGAVAPLDLAQIVAPHVFQGWASRFPAHEFPLYFGAVPLALMVWHLARPDQWGRARAATIAAAAVGLAALLASFGRAGLVCRLQELVPLAAGFRCPARYLVLSHLAIALLAAVAFARLTRGTRRTPGREERALWMLVALSVIVAAGALVLRHRLPIAPTKYVLAGPLLIGAATWLIASAARGARWARAALVLLAAVDAGAYGLGYAVLRHTHPLPDFIAATAVPPDTAPEPFRRTFAAENAVVLAGWQRIDGYAGLEPARRLDYGQLAALRAAGVRWVRANKLTRAIAGLADRGGGWLEVPDPMSRARLVSRVRRTTNPAVEIGRIFLDTTALVGEKIELPDAPPGSVTVLADRPGLLLLETDCARAQLLVTSERFHRGWQAIAAGSPVRTLCVNGDFLGCHAAAGRQRVVFSFRARNLWLGRVFALVGVGLVATRALLAIAACRRLRRRPQKLVHSENSTILRCRRRD